MACNIHIMDLFDGDGIWIINLWRYLDVGVSEEDFGQGIRVGVADFVGQSVAEEFAVDGRPGRRFPRQINRIVTRVMGWSHLRFTVGYLKRKMQSNMQIRSVSVLTRFHVAGNWMLDVGWLVFTVRLFSSHTRLIMQMRLACADYWLWWTRLLVNYAET